MMKIKNEYVAPKMIAMSLSTKDLVTVSSDEEDNWLEDVFGSQEKK